MTVMLKTIYLEQPSSDNVVPAHGSMMFGGIGDTYIKLKAVRVAGLTADCPLKATAVLIPDVTIEEGVRRAFPVKDGVVTGVRTLSPAEWFLVKVENPSDTPLKALVVAHADATMGIADPPRFEEDGLICMTPVGSRRVLVPAGCAADCRLTFPYDCTIRRVTTRSDSALDVVFESLQVANVSLMHGGALPVEFFYGGVEVKAPRVTAANRMSARLMNASSADRWVEIDVGIENDEGSPKRASN